LAPIPVSGVSELVLEVNDLEAAERFYAGVLGFPVVERWGERGAVWVMAGQRTRLGLWRPQVGIAGGRGGVHVHYAMHVDEREYDEAVTRLREASQDVHEEDFSGYGHGRGRAAYVTDPDGHVVEFWTWDVGLHLAEVGGG
jgi:catechol 2,3-dioxygenase-like lactoylglutathione lyase family enzyme